jgi:hypothetical protein
MDSLYNWVVLNGMILLNVIMGFIEMVCDKVDIALKAINDSSVSNVLIFRNRNECPWLSKENALPVLKDSHLCYSFNDKRFYGLNTGDSEFLKMNDVIMVELVDASGTGVCEMSEFFHSVKWSSSSLKPSVYEFVLVNLFNNNMCLSEEYLSKCVLNVITLENPSLSISLSNPLAKNDFVSWDLFSPVEPSEPEVPVASEVVASEALST